VRIGIDKCKKVGLAAIALRNDARSCSVIVVEWSTQSQ